MTSGGDAPGMNAAIRSVVRTAINHGIRVFGVQGGYEGLIEGDFVPLDAETVSNIIHKGGTILETARTERFKESRWRGKAYDELRHMEIDAVVLIGGNGSFAGADAFTREFPVPFIGIPKTIDNDIYGTDMAIGFDTATNTALEAIDKIRDTANSHHRLFFVEVMGNDLGFIALHAGIAAGAEAILLPELKNNTAQLIQTLEKGWTRKKRSMIVVVAEGAVEGGAEEVARQVGERFKHYEIRVTNLGHVQRGGNPSCADRLLASLLGNEAIKSLLNGSVNVVIGQQAGGFTKTSFMKAAGGRHELDRHLLVVANELMR